MTKRKPLSEHKRTGRRPWRQFSDEQITRMAALWHEGRSQTFIAREFGTAQVVVSRVLRAAGIATPLERRPGQKRGSDAHRWKGGKIRTSGGYVGVLYPPDGPFASMRHRMGYVLEHRLVMAESIGRSLDSHETVHHVNGVKDDNRRENLQLRNGRHGKGVALLCLDCGSTNIESRPLH